MLQKIIDIVKEAGKLVAAPAAFEVSQKSNFADFVTDRDVATQKFLIEKFKGLIPDAGFLGEEEGVAELEREYVFVIDPIDGTANFVAGYRESVISVALMQNGEVRWGVVYNPYSDEIFYAEKGKGAYLNGKPAKVSEVPLRNSLVAVGMAPYNRERTDLTFKTIRGIYDVCADIRRGGSAAHDACRVAVGRCALMFEMGLHAWDFYAARLIVEEAGGVFAYVDGKEYTPLDTCPVVMGTKEAVEKFKEIYKSL
jgi:myo-inositol-1(or 4)-monophosphatase